MSRDEKAVAALFQEAAWRFGGIDICVSNAGIASAAPIEDTTLALWQRNIDILATGYFLISRQAVQVLKAQGLGGSIVFIGSKNALAASPGASAYCTAKAAELHLARCLALEACSGRDSGQCRQSGCGAAGIANLAGRVGRAAGQSVQDNHRTSWNRCIASAAC